MARPLRVLFTNFHRSNGGGHDTYVLSLLQGLAQDHAITLAAPAASRLYRLAGEIVGVRRAAVDFAPRGLRWLSTLWILWKLLNLRGVDIVHVNGSADHKLMMLVRLASVRRPCIIFTKHNDHRNHSFGNALRAVLGTDHVIAVSQYVAGKLNQSPYRAVPATTIAHGIDTAYFAPAPVGEASSYRRNMLKRYFDHLSGDEVVFASTAGTQYEKGWVDLLDAVALLEAPLRQRVRVILAGDAPLPCMLAKVDALGLTRQVCFTGLLDDVRPALAAANLVFVLSRRETLSYACREAMTMGLPVIVSDAGGLPENVVHGTDGWIVPGGDIAALVSTLEEILQSPQVLADMGRAALVKSRTRFCMEAFLADTLSVYRAVLRPMTADVAAEPALTQHTLGQ